jgi:uncharacterized protein (TIGR02453 family)
MINKDTITFLSTLSENNNKPWFDANRDWYQQARQNIEEVTTAIIAGIGKFDSGIKGIAAKSCMFRINRDIRFSANKLPYKNNMGAYISAGGKKSAGPGYYMHVEPGNCFLAGGVYQPEPAQLNAIRQEIDYNADEFLKIINDKKFKPLFGQLDQDDKLKTAPKGYAKDHPQLELLQLKSYIALHPLKARIVTQKDFVGYTVDVFKAMYPFHRFLKRSLD